MSNLNKVFLMGRLTRDPELRYTPQGTAVSDLGLAVNREYTLPSGERRKETLFVDVTVWKKQAEVICQYLKKGNPILIEGRLTMDSWEDKDGQKRNRIKVTADNFQFIGGPARGGEPGSEPGEGFAGGYRRQPAPAQQAPSVQEPSPEEYPPPQEDIPF